MSLVGEDILELVHANALTDETVKQLKKQKDPEAEKGYFLTTGTFLDVEQNPVGMIQNSKEKVNADSPDKPVKYSQVLSMDDRHLLTYTCVE